MPWIWITLPVLAIITFYIYPFITTVFVSFTKTKPLRKIGPFIGIENYTYVLNDPEFWGSHWHGATCSMREAPSITS